MIIFITDNFSKKVKFVAYYQIIGGAIGNLLSLWLMIKYNGGILLLLGTFGLYTYSMYCGKLLLEGKIIEGLRFSSINQAIQTINFA
jgi:lipoprotein signal peptidase